MLCKRADLLALVMWLTCFSKCDQDRVLLTLSYYMTNEKPTAQHHNQRVTSTGCNWKNACAATKTLCASSQVLNCVWIFVTLWTVACQAPLSMEFSSKNTRASCHFLLQGSSYPRDWTCVSWVSWIGRQILYPWATWEAHYDKRLSLIHN